MSVTPQPDRREDTGLARRTMLRGGLVVTGTVAASGLLVACGGGSSSSGSGDTGSSGSGSGGSGSGGTGSSTPTKQAGSGGSGSDSGAGSSSGSGTATGTDLGASSSIAVGGGKIFASEKVVVTQPTKGAFKAFSAICTHQGCLVTKVTDGKIECPCHGSEFSIKDGSVIQGPATEPLPSMTVAVQAGQVRVS